MKKEKPLLEQKKHQSTLSNVKKWRLHRTRLNNNTVKIREGRGRGRNDKERWISQRGDQFTSSLPRIIVMRNY